MREIGRAAFIEAVVALNGGDVKAGGGHVSPLIEHFRNSFSRSLGRDKARHVENHRSCLA
jgi:hypothetical protein